MSRKWLKAHFINSELEEEILRIRGSFNLFLIVFDQHSIWIDSVTGRQIIVSEISAKGGLETISQSGYLRKNYSIFPYF